VSSGPSLRFTFLESGKGETVLIDFPDGTVGVVDCCPSATGCRPSLVQELANREIAFVCLTHPHEDHGKQMDTVLDGCSVSQFWHSLPDVEPFFYWFTEKPTFRSPLSDFAESQQVSQAEFMIHIWATILRKRISALSYDASRQSVDIAGVRVHFLGPDRDVVQKELNRLQQSINDRQKTPSELNNFSLILGFEFANTLVILGGDALRAGWRDAYRAWKRANLPKARILKVPHHGARNSFDLRPANQRDINIWDFCTGDAIAVLFAGDFQHPNPDVLRELKSRTDLISLFDPHATRPPANPLGLQTLGARYSDNSLRPKLWCRAILEVSSSGAITRRLIP
jgi:beta-lactamase superfamily II metal-dependent hydrolase